MKGVLLCPEKDAHAVKKANINGFGTVAKLIAE